MLHPTTGTPSHSYMGSRSPRSCEMRGVRVVEDGLFLLSLDSYARSFQPKVSTKFNISTTFNRRSGSTRVFIEVRAHTLFSPYIVPII
jgi:hypothetical protein